LFIWLPPLFACSIQLSSDWLHVERSKEIEGKVEIIRTLSGSLQSRAPHCAALEPHAVRQALIGGSHDSRLNKGVIDTGAHNAGTHARQTSEMRNVKCVTKRLCLPDR